MHNVWTIYICMNMMNITIFLAVVLQSVNPVEGYVTSSADDWVLNRIF
jgi:hypothetical protein